MQHALYRNYLEQKLENVQDVTGRVKYNCGSKGTQFRVKEGVIGVKVKDILYVWSRPMKKYRGSMPLECEKIDPAFIRTEDATYCRRCRSWKKIAAGMKHCTCGGYLVLRRRYSTSPVDAWDGGTAGSAVCKDRHQTCSKNREGTGSQTKKNTCQLELCQALQLLQKGHLSIQTAHHERSTYLFQTRQGMA